jgi:hypothetical protein
MSGVVRCGQYRWLRSSLRVSPPGPGGMGRVRVRGSRSGQGGALLPGGGGQNRRRPRAWAGGQNVWRRPAQARGRGGSCGLVRAGGGRPGQAADLPVAHPVAGQGEEPASTTPPPDEARFTDDPG